MVGTEELPRAEALQFLYGTYQQFARQIGLGTQNAKLSHDWQV
jgi:hypothetical protein